jgi:hypothetical protein
MCITQDDIYPFGVNDLYINMIKGPRIVTINAKDCHGVTDYCTVLKMFQLISAVMTYLSK